MNFLNLRKEEKVKRILMLMMCVALCILICIGCGSKEAQSDSTRVVCKNGIMIGQEENNVVSFLGVPYAQQPVGDLRWKAPVAAEASDEEIICNEFGKTAIQYEWQTEAASYSEKGEDCLSLNIWTADGEVKDKPVMVFIHGGGYSWGGTTDPIYNGQNFVEANPDTVLVTVNYRLGIMAWADFTQIPGGEEYTDFNLGIRDQICALEWVQENIESFGGNPDNVTIFGESAGGASVSILVASPAAEGLFQKAIIQSGSAVYQGNYLRPEREDAQEFAAVMAETAGCDNMEEMLEITGEEWMELDSEYWLGDESPGPFVDGEIVPENYIESMENAAKRGVDLMIGYNADENFYQTEEYEGKDKKQQWKDGLEEFWEETYKNTDDEGRALLDSYMDIQKGQDKEEAFGISQFVTEKVGYCAFEWAENYAKAGGNVYMYYWDVPSTSDKYYKKACHAVELSYVFNNLEETIYSGKNPDKETAVRAQEAWTAFAKDGNPSTEYVKWPAYDNETRQVMVIELESWEAQKDILKEQRGIFKEFIENHIGNSREII